MDNQDDDTETTGPFGKHPFAWVMVPLVALAVVSIWITCLRFRRTRQQALAGVAGVRDPESLRRRQHMRPTGASRWQWGGQAAPQGLRRPRNPGSREEGLNEFGEAPPAYTKSPDQFDHVELSNMAPVHGASPPTYRGTDNAAATTVSQAPATPPPAFVPSRQ